MMFPQVKVCRMLGHNLGMFWQPCRLGTETKVSIEVSRALGRDEKIRFKQGCDYQYKCYIWPRSASDHKSDLLLFCLCSLRDTSTRAACFKRAATSWNSSTVHQLGTRTCLFCSLIFHLSLLKAQSALQLQLQLQGSAGRKWDKMYMCMFVVI